MSEFVYVNAGAFKNYGGWVLETQFIPNMGSEYLMAHGLGRPVADASTVVEFPAPGKYRMWVFTKDWVAYWKQDMSPGIFNVSIDGERCPTTFGQKSKNWAWQDGGIIEAKEKSATITMHDLTGFEGRFAGLFFAKDGVEFALPECVSSLLASRGETNLGEYDFVVAGGGMAGICAAVMAARRGVKTALVHDRDVVGGNNSSEVRVWLGGETNFDPLPKMGNLTREFDQAKEAHYGAANTAELYEDDKKMALLKAEPNLTVLTGYFLTGAEMEDVQISAVQVYDVKKGAYGKISAKLFADCTGDGTLAHLAGADYEITTNAHMGMSNLWHIEKTDSPQPFPRCPWAIDLSNVDFPGRRDFKDHYGNEREFSFGCWFWESGMEHDPIAFAEYARDTNFRAMYGAFDAVKNVDNDYENYYLKYASYTGGKRESRRVLGDVLLTKAEVKAGLNFPDGIVPSTWNFDVHGPNRKHYAAFHEGDAFLSFDYHEDFPKPFWVPYRCLYSRNVPNLFTAGRDVSVSHDALGTVRVMRTCGMMGEAVGKAAEICVRESALPRDVYEKHLDELLEAFK